MSSQLLLSSRRCAHLCSRCSATASSIRCALSHHNSLPFVNRGNATSRSFHADRHQSSPQLRCLTTAAAAQNKPKHPKSSKVSPQVDVNSFALPSHIKQTACGLYLDHSLPPNFSKILIANRGEIACRIIRTCRELGVRTVAIYSVADAQSQFVAMADEAYQVGTGPTASESYLRSDDILSIAKRTGAQAIHPGYGFLSENAAFSQQCAEHGIVFIGPPASSITAMGSKSASKHIMTAARVPVVPGYHNDDQQSTDHLCAEAMKLGLPLMLKGVSGGGGKGMRIVRDESELRESIDACKRESLASFKDERILMERYIERPRHIEFQIFADRHGNCVHLYERDCSTQRRHQKILEESPAPHMTRELRTAMGQAAVNAALAVNYVGAGTVEFIFDTDTNEYFFMEMNTRLQVEHPITEMIVRRDLVQLQLHCAFGGVLPFTQQSHVAPPFGHAIEARIYAENTYANFLPDIGRLHYIRAPYVSSSLRVESGVRQGDSVSLYYDPMISKLCVHGATREQALRRMLRALSEYHIVGPKNNVDFLKRCIVHPLFAQGLINTSFIAQQRQVLLPEQLQINSKMQHLVYASILLHEQRNAQPKSAWDLNDGFRVNAAPLGQHRAINLQVVDQTEKAAPDSSTALQKHAFISVVDASSPSCQREFMSSDSVAFDVSEWDGKVLPQLQDDKLRQQSTTRVYAKLLTSTDSVSGKLTFEVSAYIDSQLYHATVVRHDLDFHVFSHADSETGRFRLPVPNYKPKDEAAKHSSAALAPMSGRIVKVNCAAGDSVKKGQALVIMEAMKMELIIRCSIDSLVTKVNFKSGDVVQGGKALVEFAPPATAAADAAKQ